MQPSGHRPPPPWERNPAAPRHPAAPAHLRFPGEEVPAAAADRHHRADDGAGAQRVREGIRLKKRRPSRIDRLRRAPMRHGLIGLSIVGAAAPLAVARYHSMRVDPSHEQEMGLLPHVLPLNEESVGQAWRQAATRIETDRSTAREGIIGRKMERYKEMGLSRQLAETIYDLALREEIDPEVAFGLVRTESEFKPTARSHVGAIGLTQLMPSTARWMKPGVTDQDLRDPETNLGIGFRYLRELLEKYDGDQRLALLAYNRGPGIVDRVLKRGGNPDNGYVEAVLTGEGVHR